MLRGIIAAVEMREGVDDMHCSEESLMLGRWIEGSEKEDLRL